jgi:AraC family L-rhamnose operon regulatory protein RhaS
MALLFQVADYFHHPGLPVALFRRDHGIVCLPHHHHFHEIVFVLRGQAVHVVDGYAHEFAAGDLLLIRAGQVHHYRDVRDLGLISVLFLPPSGGTTSSAIPGAAGELFPHETNYGCYHGHLSPGWKVFGGALALVRGMEAGFSSQAPNDSGSVMEQFQFLLAMLAHYRNKARETRSPGGRISHFELAEHRITPALKHLEEHFSDSVRLDDLADLASMPSRTLLRQFQTVTGRSPFVYLHDVRLHHAMLELRQTTKCVTDIAYDVGFNDLSFFNRKFKSLTGLPPTAWRQKRPHEW